MELHRIQLAPTGIGLAYFLKIVPIDYQGIIMFCIALVFFGAIALLLTVFGGDKTNDYFHKSSSLIMFFLSQVSFAICVIYAVNYFFIITNY